MNCSKKNISIVGLLLGIVVFAINMTGLTNALLYYASGMRVVDMFMQGRGESAIGIALFFYLVASVLTMTLYCYVFCKVKAAWLRKK